jgi:hypothetical protein
MKLVFIFPAAQQQGQNTKKSVPEQHVQVKPGIRLRMHKMATGMYFLS